MDFSHFVQPGTAEHMILAFFQADGIHRAAADTGPAPNTVVINPLVWPRVGRQFLADQDGHKTSCHSFVGDQPFGQPKGTQTAHICRMPLRPVAAEGFLTDARIAG